MSHNGISDLMPRNLPPTYPKPSYFVSAMPCMYCGRTPTGVYDNCDYCGALVRRGYRVDITMIQDATPRYRWIES